MQNHVQIRPEPILLFFHLFFFQAILFSYLFCSLSSYFSTHKKFFLVYLQLLSMHDCCIRVIHNMVTALLEYLDLLAVFQKHNYVDLILLVTILVEYLHLCNAKWAKLQFSDTHFSNFSPIFPEFYSLLLASYFSKKFAAKSAQA